MKKSMLALFGCALVAGSVMAAEVAGNNTAVVIQKDAVVSSNLYQFLIVPVKGFDITGSGQTVKLSLNEILPPALHKDGTIVYENGTTDIAEVKGGQWVWQKNTNTPFEETYAVNTILWLQSPVDIDVEEIPSTVFCGELVNDTVAVTPIPGQFVAFGNATSLAVTLGNPTSTASTEVTLNAIVVNNGGAKAGDMIYRLKSGSGDYEIVRYSGTHWMKAPASGITPVNADNDLLPAGAAAYYYRKATN